jgi:hypothetical protein
LPSLLSEALKEWLVDNNALEKNMHEEMLARNKVRGRGKFEEGSLK